ncbi:MAG: condensation domain-containing protein, partial [Planctomycetota bacterium]
MNLDDLQAELAERGCVLWVEGEMLRFKAPDGALTPPLMSQLRRNKRALIERLRGDAQHGGDGANPPGGSGANPPSGDVGPTREPSYGQQAMWLLHQAVPLSPAYNVASAVQVHGPIDYGAVERVWRTLLTRHDSLRTTFQLRGGRLAACVQQQPATDAKRVLVPTEAGPAAGPAAVDAELRRLVDASYRAPFDLTAGPLARLRLFSVGETRHVLLLSMHHIVLDAWSLWVLHDEFGALYRQESRGEVGVLLAAEASYGDFVRWQQALPDSEAGRSQWQSWRQRLAGCPEPARLVWDRRRPAARAQRGASLHFRLPAELSGQLRELGRQRGATPFMTLLAVFQALLHLHSGQRDFVVGTTSSGRSEPRFARLVGYLVNTLPLRAKIEPGCRFSGLLEQTRGEVIAAIGAQDFPFPLTVQRLNPPRESGALPLCRVMFGLQKPHDFSEAMIALDDASRSIDWGGLRASTYELDQQEGQFDLTLEMYETSTTFLGILKYDTALLDRETAQLLAARYRRLAELV